jgi:hypothetical protein
MEIIYEDIFRKRFNKEQFLENFSPVGTEKSYDAFYIISRTEYAGEAHRSPRHPSHIRHISCCECHET